MGITIDKHLKWNERITELSKKIKRFIKKFYQIRKILNIKQLMMVYRALLESLEYGLLVGGASYQNTINQLQIVQNYILGVAFNKHKYFSTSLLYIEKS